MISDILICVISLCLTIGFVWLLHKIYFLDSEQPFLSRLTLFESENVTKIFKLWVVSGSNLMQLLFCERGEVKRSVAVLFLINGKKLTKYKMLISVLEKLYFVFIFLSTSSSI